MRRFVTVMILLGAFGSQAPAQSGLGLLQPDAAVVLGIEWRKMVDSALGMELTSQMKSSQFSAMPGMDEAREALMHGLDSILIAAPASALGKPGGPPPALVVVKGRFNLDQLRGLARGKTKTSETYRSVELLAPEDGGPGDAQLNRIALLDANTILGGDRDQVRAAIDRMKTGKLTSASAGILGGVADLSAKNDIWMIFDMPANMPKDAPPAAAQMFANVKGAEFGLSFQQGLGLLLNVRTKDADSATSMAQMLQGLIAMGAMNQPPSPQAADVVKKIRISSENSRVKVSLNLDRSEVQKLIDQFKASATAPTRPVAATRPAPRAAEPSRPKTVRITGLDSGPVEAPLAGSQK